MASAALGGEEVTYTRRFFGDNLLEGLLMVFTLFIGWLIWLAIVAPRGQTPAKQLLNVYIHDYKTGQRATAGTVWMREMVWKNGIPLIVGIAAVIIEGNADGGLSNLGSLYTLVGALFLFGEERRALWDRLSGTIVRYHEGGFREFDPMVLAVTTGPNADRRLQELELLRTRGLITDEEYQAKRAQILATV